VCLPVLLCHALTVSKLGVRADVDLALLDVAPDGEARSPAARPCCH
jgi:hypothetical protein